MGCPRGTVPRPQLAARRGHRQVRDACVPRHPGVPFPLHSPGRIRAPNRARIHSSDDEGDAVSEQIKAIVAEAGADGKMVAGLKTLSLSDLPNEDVLVHVAYSTVNYKDGLAVTGKGKICRTLPMVPGIDIAGTVVESRDANWHPGDRVVLNGSGLSEDQWGGYAQKQRVRGAFLVRCPDEFSFAEAMALGTAGYTAMLCVNAIRDHGVKPADGPIVVSGAAGGVGSVAIILLARLGYEIAAVTGRPATGEWLKSLGATTIVPRDELARDAKPLEKERWAAGVDNVGANTLATMLAQTKYEGIVAACGLAGGMGLPTSVMPFILRGVTLRGIDSVQAALPRRQRAWRDLAQLIDRDALAKIYTTKPLAEVPALANQILGGTIQGRVVIDVNA
ncbi:MAG: oxidoreductase [Gammaproteobacteria bacterium]|nr:oxidoreductase [Gammaproteobacteria bacterium]